MPSCSLRAETSPVIISHTLHVSAHEPRIIFSIVKSQSRSSRDVPGSVTIASASLMQKSQSSVMSSKIGPDAFDASVAFCVKGALIVMRINVEIC
jgi:hypothetical protein